MPTLLASTSRFRVFVEIFLTAIIYFLLARLSLQLQFNSSNATPVWPPSGFAFAMIILLGYRIAPGILLGALLANIVVFISNKTCTLPKAIVLSSLISIGNTLESLIGFYLLKKVIPTDWHRNFFGNVYHIFNFLGVSIFMCFFSSTIGTAAVYLGHILEPEQYSMVWLTWWMGDLSGILLFTPFLLVWIYFLLSGDSIFSKTPERNVEVVIFFPIVVLSSGIVFDEWFSAHFIFQFAFWMIPVLVWTAIRFDIGVTVTYVMVSSVIAIWGTLHRHGPFSFATLNESLLSLQAFVAIIVITSLALNASVVQQKKTEGSLRDAGNQLEIRVQERTAELAQATNQLLEQNKHLEKMNAELKAFSYVASHDLQEPLRKIQTISMRIMEKEQDVLSDTGKDYFKRLHTSANRMQTLIEDLLAYSRTNIHEKNFETVHLGKIVDDVKEDLKDILLQKSGEVEFSGNSEAYVIPYQFRQLLYNLVSNSVKFASPERPPHIRIKSEIITGRHLIHPGLSDYKNYCHITVADNGIGFEYEHHERIFEIFQRLHDAQQYPGTGVGLAICKKIIENHEGFISAQSEPGKGTTFYISIPA